MVETKKKQKLAQKRKFIINRLRELNLLSEDKEIMTESQKEIYEKIWNFDFSYWEKVKEENGWGNKEKLSESERYLRDKKGRVRSYLRENNVLPSYGDPMNEEQQKIFDDIENGDFTYFENFKKEKMVLLQSAKNVDKLKIVIDNNLKVNKRSDLPGYKPNSLPKMVFHRLRMCQILPPLNEPLNELHMSIMDDVNENWLGKTKSYFIIKYLEHSTPEGRLLYRMYKSHLDYGFNFNLTIDDIVIPEKCPLLEIPLSTDPKDFKEKNYYTADRIDSSKGLVKGNIQVISMLANRMKNKATESELLTFATNGLKILNNVEI